MVNSLNLQGSSFGPFTVSMSGSVLVHKGVKVVHVMFLMKRVYI